MMTNKELVQNALKARQRAYTPYSKFKVGAALLGRDGELFLGCNIENASYSPTCCAERVAFLKAVSENVLRFEKIAIVGGLESSNALELCAPCGVCRQVMLEFCDDNFGVILAKDEDNIEEYTLGEIMPKGFRATSLI